MKILHILKVGLHILKVGGSIYSPILVYISYFFSKILVNIKKSLYLCP